MPLPPYYLEVVMVSGVACLAVVMMNGRGGLQVLFVSFTKGPGGFPNLARNIKESIYIRVNNPTLNNNIGKFNLSHIWDRVLLNTKGLTLNKQGNNNIN